MCQCKHSGITKSDFWSAAPVCVFFLFPHLKCHYSPTMIWCQGNRLSQSSAGEMLGLDIPGVNLCSKVATCAAHRSLRGAAERTCFRSCSFIRQPTRADRSTGALNYTWRLGCGWRLFHTTLWKWNDCAHHWRWACTCTWGSWGWIVGEVFVFFLRWFGSL